MSDRPDTPGAPPPPPPGDAPPPASPPGPPPAAPPPSSPTGGSQNTLMLVLSYLWILALIPFFAEKDDPEVQWHAKNGLVLTAAEFIVWVVLMVIGAVLESIVGLFGCLTGMLGLLIWLGVIVLHVVAIVKAVGGGRLVVPGVSQYADRF